MSGWWQQVLAAVLAVAIPLITKALNDWKKNLEGEATPAPDAPGSLQPPAAAKDNPTPPTGTQQVGTT